MHAHVYLERDGTTRHFVEHRRVSGQGAHGRGPPTTGHRPLGDKSAPWAVDLPKLLTTVPLCSARAGLYLPRKTSRYATAPTAASATRSPPPGGARHRPLLTAAPPGAACRPTCPAARGCRRPLSLGRLPSQTLPRGRPERAPAKCPFHSGSLRLRGRPVPGTFLPTVASGSLLHARRSQS